MPELSVGADNYILKNPVTGELTSVAKEQADSLAAAGGLHYAEPGDIERYNLEQRRGGAGQVALGLAEKATRTATLGAVSHLGGTDADARERAQYNERENPTSSAVAGAAPAVAAAAATAGAGLGLGAGMAAQGAIGGLANLGAAQDEAFQRDQKLSTEAAWGSFGGGVLLGAGAEVGLAAIGKGIGAAKGVARNRFVEASGGVARSSEKAAFEQAGIVRPAEGLSKAAEDPVAAATIRKAAKEARPEATVKLQDAVREAQAVHDTVASAHDPVPDVNGDILQQRHSVRGVIDGLRSDVEAIGSASDRAIPARAMESLDAANSSADVYDTLRQARAEMRRNLDLTEDPDLAKVFEKWEGKARELEESKDTFGAPADDVAAKNAALRDADQARSALNDALQRTDYSRTAGTAAGKPVEDAIADYSAKLRTLLEGNESTEAKSGLASLDALDAVPDAFKDVAYGNQVDALSASAVPAKTGKAAGSMAHDLIGHAADLALEHALPGAGLVRKAWKYRAHIARLAGWARESVEGTSDGLLGVAEGAGKAEARGAAESAAEDVGAATKSPEYASARDKIDALRGKQNERGYVVLGEREPGATALSKQSLSSHIDALPEVALDSLPHVDEPTLERLKSMSDRSEESLLPEEREQMGIYIGSGFENMRAAENGTLPTATPEAIADLKAKISNLKASKDFDEARKVQRQLDKLDVHTGIPKFLDAADKTSILKPTQHGPLYRGIDGLPKQAMHELLDHDEFITAATTSSSYNPQTARAFGSGHNSVLFKIDSVDMGSIAPLGKMGAGEQEVLLPKGAKFQVIKRERLADARGTNALVVTVRQTGWAKPHEMQALGAMGFADTGMRKGLQGIATSPIGLTAGAAGLGTAGVYAKNKVQAYFANIDADPEKAYAKVKGAIENLVEHPDQLADSLTKQFGDMPSEAPDLFQNVGAQAQRAVQFLKDKIPPAVNFSLLYPEGPPPSRTDILQLSLYWRGATDPHGTLQRIANGTAMPEEVEAFRAVSPSWYSELQEATVVKAQSNARAGKPLGAYRVAELESTLDLAGQLDPTFSDTVAQVYQTSVAIREQQTQQPDYIPPPKASQRIQQKAPLS